MQLKHGVRVGRPLGIPLHVHGSWFPAAALLVAHFALTIYAGMEPIPAVALGILSAITFFGCLVAHELGHAVVARGLGIRVVDITLFIFGGIARIAREPSKPAQEIVIAGAGPLVSAGIAAGALWAAGDGTGTWGLFFWTIGMANLALVLFNLLPGFPLDGGRILRAVLWRRSGDYYRATMRAGRMGQALGILLAVTGLLLFLVIGEAYEGGAAEGLWLAVVGGFLLVLASASRRAARVTRAIAGQAAGTWARPFTGTLNLDSTLHRLAPDGHGPVAVTDDGRLAGVLLPERLAATVSSPYVRDLMVPWTPQLSFPAAKPMTRALELLANGGDGVLVVVDETGTVVGVLDREDVRSRLKTGGVR